MDVKIPLKNYLLILDDVQYVRKGSDNLRVYRIGYIIKQIYKEIKNFKSASEIEKETWQHQSYSTWILDKNAMSIQNLYKLCIYWKQTCKKSEKEFQQLWDYLYEQTSYFSCTNGKQVKLPKHLDYKLSYLLGYIFGDGHLADPNRSYDKKTSYNSELRITDGNKETFIFLQQIFQDLFDYTPKIYSEKSRVGKYFYRFVIRSKPIHRFIMDIGGMPVGNKSGKLDVPPLIKNAPLELQRWFISGFSDADGCLRLAQGKYSEVSISQLNPKILISIMEISKFFDIKWNGPYKCDCQRNHGYFIRLSNREMVERFLSTFKPLNPIKVKRAEMLWQRINQLKLEKDPSM